MQLLEYATRIVRRYPWMNFLPLLGLASQLEVGMESLAQDRPDLLTEEARHERDARKQHP